MACDCSTFECLDVVYNPCLTGVEINVLATETANWTIRIEFNGTWSDTIISVSFGDKLIIPTALLNEFYSHQLKIYDSAGDLVNDTCYSLKANASVNAAGTILPPVVIAGKESFILQFNLPAGDTVFQDDSLIGADFISLSVEGSDMYVGNNPGEIQPFDSLTGTITWNEAFGTDMRCKIEYKK